MTKSPSVLFIYPGEARRTRLDAVETKEAPKDFFYGYTHIRDAGYIAAMANSRKDPDGVWGKSVLLYERLRNRYQNFGLASSRVMAIADEISNYDVALSFNDFFSLSLGYYRHLIKSDTVLLGGFHGLSDIPDRVKAPFQGYATQRIKTALSRLDHVFFSGEVDRSVAIEKFGIPEEKTSYYPFGVDTEFWHPAKVEEQTGLLSIGSDINRDFQTLIDADIDDHVRIITRLNVSAPETKPNIEIVRGNLNNSPITDVKLRELYQHAKAVVVPLKDVWQPTGCSVTLQAMACGKPVIISDIKGLWDRDILKSGENCMLVKPHDPQSIAEAVRAIQGDPELCQRLGEAARQTAEKHLAIHRMESTLEKIILEQAEKHGKQ